MFHVDKTLQVSAEACRISSSALDTLAKIGRDRLFLNTAYLGLLAERDN